MNNMKLIMESWKKFISEDKNYEELWKINILKGYAESAGSNKEKYPDENPYEMFEVFYDLLDDNASFDEVLNIFKEYYSQDDVDEVMERINRQISINDDVSGK